MRRAEFIALCAAIMSLNALAIDIMLPGLQQIGSSLGVASENHRQFVITAYLLGMGFAQLLFGPLSDRFGRRIPLLIGVTTYVLAAVGAAFAPNFETLLLLRAVQGVGAASTRVIAVSVVRDVFGGRAMAEVLSLIFMIFMVIPVVAPSIGQAIMLFAEWHLIFGFMAALGFVFLVWIFFRLPETLHPEDTRQLRLSVLAQGFRMVVTNRTALWYMLASTFVFGALFGFINSAQQIYVGIYDLGAWFPILFAAVAAMMSVASFTNSRLVGRFGMRRLSHTALCGFLSVAVVWFAVSLLGPMPLWLFVLFFAACMFQFGLLGSNFGALAMEPLGHVAGMASSIQGFVTTLGGALIGAFIGQSFNGTVQPLIAGFMILAFISLILVLIAEKGKLFQASSTPIDPAAGGH
ncbi:multidrug effflux MFS transporter [Tianweitania sp. BSSL-BM11]|uniref:Bcr/CflA family efflux transporter n=1 Tax=Tianweitania aestuarii TaxID=2814886 RepID=A0ABS5RUL5_9HYPH|nr:multidrug effflux MFS transporter [Tianweitania aestuarii]